MTTQVKILMTLIELRWVISKWLAPVFKCLVNKGNYDLRKSKVPASRIEYTIRCNSWDEIRIVFSEHFILIQYWFFDFLWLADETGTNSPPIQVSQTSARRQEFLSRGIPLVVLTFWYLFYHNDNWNTYLFTITKHPSYQDSFKSFTFSSANEVILMTEVVQDRWPLSVIAVGWLFLGSRCESVVELRG